MTEAAPQILDEIAEHITVRGLVQGVGFRPTVWRLARQHHIRGTIANNGNGVEIHAGGSPANIEKFVAALQTQAPPLARVDKIVRRVATELPLQSDFQIIASHATAVHTGVVPDAATCEACRAETLDPFARRFRYPFTNCTHCGPRLSIIRGIPYDRPNTTMNEFALCAECSREYHDPADRRFHAQAIACHKCGPRAWLERADGKPVTAEMFSMLDDVDAACTLLQKGYIIAIKGIGGF